ncbi:MAG: lipid-A-disaccharide synthase [Candidatus Sericytochromatia bacterium]|nr:lipid-A-disaccharide synthase [Candidatus Sericytochromatia bacterium]
MTRSPLLFLSAGEVSGDEHGAALAQALRQRQPGCRMVGLGGVHMRAQGVELLADLTPHGAVGLIEQWPHLPAVLAAFWNARRWLAEHRPDAVVLIDFQGANLRLAAQARRLGIPTVYYMLPQAWLWGLPGDLRRVSRSADLLLAAFKPEAEAYAAAGGKVTYVGHPLLDRRPPSPPGEHSPSPGTVALLPGSRRHEVESLLPIFLEVARRLLARLPDLRFVLPVPQAALLPSVRARVAASELPIALLVGESQPDWRRSDLALLASGTAVLEAAIHDIPCIAAYRVAPLTAAVARWLLRGRHVTLPNILLGREAVPEFLQARATAERLTEASLCLLEDPAARERQREDYAELRRLLGSPGASQRAADSILATLELSR